MSAPPAAYRAECLENLLLAEGFKIVGDRVRLAKCEPEEGTGRYVSWDLNAPFVAELRLGVLPIGRHLLFL